MTLGEFIRKRREELGMRQGDLGDLIGKDQAYVSQIERGAILRPSLEVLYELAKALRTSRFAMLQAGGWIEEEYTDPSPAPGVPDGVDDRRLLMAGKTAEFTESEMALVNALIDQINENRRGAGNGVDSQ